MSSNEDKAKQITGVQDLIARGVKGILISPIDAVAVNAAYDAAAAARVPIVSVARGSSSPNQTLHVAMDEKEIGRDIAAWTVQHLGGKGKVAMLTGPSGAPTFRNLEEGYKEVMARQPSIQIVFNQAGPFTRERRVKQTEDALVANPDLRAIYGANDDVALGASQAVAAAGKRGKVLVTGMNGVPPALRAVKDGSLAATIELNPTNWGRLGADILAGYLRLRDERYKPQVFIPHEERKRLLGFAFGARGPGRHRPTLDLDLFGPVSLAWPASTRPASTPADRWPCAPRPRCRCARRRGPARSESSPRCAQSGSVVVRWPRPRSSGHGPWPSGLRSQQLRSAR